MSTKKLQSRLFCRIIHSIHRGRPRGVNAERVFFMLKRASELRWEHSPNHKGGKGTCHILNVLEPEEMHGTGRCYAVSVLPAGASIGKHFHTGDFETYYILKGRARYNDNGAIVEIGPGDMVHCPDGGFHAIENIGEGDLEYFTSILYTETRK